ncbi:virulence factor Mce family protein [Mycolicibacterium phlei]|jgi:phospholipid/cholesterol/gamma-HCH transport system substrate-binding protein|uniref:Mammalian cell entry protein n=1 Tax=Mycolicibacterium phlei DSM 43239 = CCUG 21000 TaxID=1226750 RepID=A0A5N5V2R2_MYCPH|nr:MCE family protein [Mycolicibacterium phlei]VEG09054.1 virulence factor Mce family protein [Mycobacteroides chelonae]AMO60938.1 mce related protein [Mycolicibacterium phlei]EID18286.1 virulence factor Mce family protein [Mycolicibacterium phlei RIVM601174]KAB7754919.1 mammalian cell entry protein [Mycolicibacterium phlei DSM 43239 = CCUG 21000]KXW61771.1 mammalian cell entry protein [Mycolicibacterium phlei DSM 43070]
MRRRILTLVLAALLIGGAAVVVKQAVLRPTVVTAQFVTATAIYPGDEVRIAGVKVGTIESIRPAGTYTELKLAIGHGIRVPADAKAVIVAQNLVSARYVQLTPAYESGPVLADGAVIPQDRTAVPVEWNEVKEQLMRLATDLGPTGEMSTGPVGRFIDSAANALDGNGDKLRETIAQLSGVGRILADGSGDIVSTIDNLQTFVTALRDSNEQIVAFQNRFATLTSLVNDSRSDLDAALTDLSEVLDETTRFVRGTRDKTSEQLQRLSNVLQNIAEHRMALENVLHIAPHSIANAVNMFDPRTGAASGVFVLNNMSSPVWALCGMVGALQNVTAPTTAKECAQYLGPGLRTASFNNLPFPFSLFLSSNPPPYMLRYSEPHLMPGAGGDADPPEPPPAVSAYTGAGDVPPPPGWGAPPPPPPPGPPTVENLLLPAEQPAPEPPPEAPPTEGATP